MIEFKVRILDNVFDDINEIADYIVAVSNPEHAVKYARELGAEIMTLRYLAGIIPESRYLSVKKYHPRTKQMPTRNKKLNIIFHIEGKDYTGTPPHSVMSISSRIIKKSRFCIGIWASAATPPPSRHSHSASLSTG